MEFLSTTIENDPDDSVDGLDFGSLTLSRQDSYLVPDTKIIPKHHLTAPDGLLAPTTI